MVKLINIVKSNLKDKKYIAHWSDNSKTHFGASGYSDYTLHHDDERKKLYIKRHKKNENWNDPKSAGALSRWILWNKRTIKDSVAYFKKKFNL